MNDIIIYAIVSLTVISIIAAVILYFVAQKFKVYEDPRIDQVADVLPAANCGGCGFAGCRNFAEACIKAESLANLYCPVGGNDCMTKVAQILGMENSAKVPEVAVVRCSGSPKNRARVNIYNGASNCKIASALYSGDTDCQNGCLGLGDCQISCIFDAIFMNKETGLPEVIDEKCTACGACVKACPKMIIELRKKNPEDRKIFVSCVNHDKGGVAKKACTVACTACTKCQKVCEFDAITIENYLAYINPYKCTFCRKCAPVCDTHTILEINFADKNITEEFSDEKEVVPNNDLKVN
jgi:Na+-translocating ferredoxin:NAD+ oxidoreductase RNF subunit RnfB